MRNSRKVFILIRSDNKGIGHYEGNMRVYQEFIRENLGVIICSR